ncbi:MAG: HAD-IB family hydrolase [Verrucomicrobia bacterium]|nr:HAD-IB family hydrolase [Verrucomicrobiota bacterium]
MSNVVVFDLDKTLARYNVSFAFGNFLYRRRIISLSCMATLVMLYVCNKMGLCSIKKLHGASFRLFVYKKESVLIQSEVDAFLSASNGSLFRHTMLEELRKAKARGDLVLIQSSSPLCIVKPIATLLGVEHAIGTQYGIDQDGKFCSIDQIIDGEAKRVHLVQFLEERGLLSKNVTAYSDSIVDLPLLESVGTPVAVCPDSSLKKIARKRKWRIAV